MDLYLFIYLFTDSKEYWIYVYKYVRCYLKSVVSEKISVEHHVASILF